MDDEIASVQITVRLNSQWDKNFRQDRIKVRQTGKVMRKYVRGHHMNHFGEQQMSDL